MALKEMTSLVGVLGLGPVAGIGMFMRGRSFVVLLV